MSTSTPVELDVPGPLTIAAQVRAARTRLGLTQAKLADLSDLAQKEIAYIESGYNVTMGTLLKVARGLKAAGSLVRLQIEPDAEWPRAKNWTKPASNKSTSV